MVNKLSLISPYTCIVQGVNRTLKVIGSRQRLT